MCDGEASVPAQDESAGEEGKNPCEPAKHQEKKESIQMDPLLWQELLQETDIARVAVLCNAALMALKVAPLQCRWPWVKHMLHLALKYSNEALALEPDNVKARSLAHFRRGCALEALERFRDAYFAYSAAFALDPADARIRAAFDRIGRYGPHELGAELKAQINATGTSWRGSRAKGARRAGTAKATETPPPDGPFRSECCFCKASVVGGDLFASPCGHGPFCGRCRRHVEEAGRFVTVPFASALRPVVADPDVNICIVSRREFSDKRTKAWQDKLEELPLFDISGVVETPDDIDPLSPAFRTPLDQLPSHEELQKQLQDAKVMKKLLRTSDRSMEELRERATSKVGHDKEYRDLIRSTVIEVLMVMWSMHASTGSTKLRWRLTCTDKQEAPTPETSLRSIFLLAGEPLEFIPQQFVDRKKFSAEQLLSPEQIRRMDSEAWAGSLTKKGTNVSEVGDELEVGPGQLLVPSGSFQAFKQVPPGWMTVLKGDSWPGMRGKGAVYRLPQFGKRVYVEVDVLEAPRIAAGTTPEDAEPEQESSPSFQSLGPLAGLAALLFAVARQTYFFKACNVMKGQKTYLGKVPDSLYDAVAGVDKLVICDCDSDDFDETQSEVISNVLRAWQLYRQDFAEQQRAFNSKVQIFNFDRTTDFELWDLERQYPSDMCYGWTRNSQGTAHFVGQFFEAFGQCQLRSPKLKLNFSRFGGLLVGVYNGAVKNKFSWFLRTSDFERTRVQFEFDFECEAGSWNYVPGLWNSRFARMVWNSLIAISSFGGKMWCRWGWSSAPMAKNATIKAGDSEVCSQACTCGSCGRPGDRMNFFSLAIDYVKAFKLQKEPQVAFVGKVDQAGPVIMEAEAETPEESSSSRGPYNGLYTPPKTTAEAVIESGLAFTMLRVKGLNEHPGGKFPVVLHQAPLERPHLSYRTADVGSISRGDVAALLVSAMSEPNCVNAEIVAGEPAGETDSSVITSTLQEDVKGGLAALGNFDVLSSEVCFSILREYKMFNVDVVVHEDASIDDFIDVLEETGTAPRQYCKCIYVYNKIDLLNVSQVDELARQPYSVVVSVSKEFNLDGLLERIWQEISVRQMFWIVLTCQRGNKTFTVENAVGLLHKSLLDEFKSGSKLHERFRLRHTGIQLRSALVWGCSVRASPQVCGLKHELQDEDVMQITKLTAAEKIKKMHGKKTGTTLAGGNTQVDPSGKKEKDKKAPLKT
eukprot:g20901.t1